MVVTSRFNILVGVVVVVAMSTKNVNSYTFGTIKSTKIYQTKQQQQQQQQNPFSYRVSSSSSSSLTKLSSSSSRRDVVESMLSSIGISSCAAVVTSMTIVPPRLVYADIDFSTIQDLLGSESNQVTQSYSGGKRPTYLQEPTDEFKLNEQKAAEFKRKNLLIKKQFIDAIEKITSDPNDYTLLASDIDAVRKLVKLNGGLPIGISKDEIVKTCRRRKSKKFWSTEVEISYQDLLMEIDYQQSPNTDRDQTFL